jgi:hypothetical protein
MKRSLFAGALLAAVMLPAGANAQETIKIGVISAYSRQFANTAAQIDNGIKLYMKQHGDSAGEKIEIIRKDPAVRTRTSPSAWRRNSSYATRPTSSPALRSRRKRSVRRAFQPKPRS